MQSSTAARMVTFGLTVLAIGMRLATNTVGAFNFNPVGAVGLFGGARLKSWQAYVIPLGLMVATDFALAVFKADADYGLLHPSRLWVYGSYAIYVLIGRWIVGDSKSPFRIGGATLLGAAQFFLITNFFEWLRMPDLYARDFAGLMTSYAAAVPFCLNTLAGDLIFTPLAFGLHAMLTRAEIPALDEQLTTARG
jgi:hypothetical protein